MTVFSFGLSHIQTFIESKFQCLCVLLAAGRKVDQVCPLVWSQQRYTEGYKKEHQLTNKENYITITLDN